MRYRRFGRTELQMPILTCGGMRFQQEWKDDVEIKEENQRRLEATVRRALALGINHIETARGYGSSEMQLGRILPLLPRDQIIVQTKVSPRADPQEFLREFEKSMSKLKLEYVDLLALHGINTMERLDWSVKPGGCLAAALKLKKQGRVRFVGFSAHWDLEAILGAINDGRFDYVNFHWYYVNPFFESVLPAAAKQDMGVLIISPNDKGGKLYEPTEKFCQATAPLSPMAFNDLWCLRRPEVHTLSIGATKPEDFDEHVKILPHLADFTSLPALLKPIEERLHAELVKTFDREWTETWHVGLPAWKETPGRVNAFEILRLRNFAKALDMISYGKMRYNLLGNADCWFPGFQATEIHDEEWQNCLRNSPHRRIIPAALREAHELLEGDSVKRLGSQK